VNAQRHTNTFRPHPLDHLYLDFTLVCSPEECGCYYHTSTTTDAITIVVAATAAATTTTIAIRGSDIDRYFQFLCPFSRLLLRTCSYVHETICTVFNVIFQSRPLLLSRSSHGVSFTREKKIRNIRNTSDSNAYMFGPFSFFSLFTQKAKTSSIFLFAFFFCNNCSL